jgi:hypothetical protein
MLRLGHCYEKVGKRASAWTLFNRRGLQARRTTETDRCDATNFAAALEPRSRG